MKHIVRIMAGPGESAAVREFGIEADSRATVLDALESIRTDRAPDLRYRHSCHHGSCGTCGAMINGKPRLMCLTRLADLPPGPVELAPLPRTVFIGDLAVLPSPLFDSLPDTDYIGSKERSADRMEACIECGLCLAGCPVTRPFVGPAALAAADREREEHPDRGAEMLAFAARPDGVEACQATFNCSRVCPQNVGPGRRIKNLKKSIFSS